MRISVSGVDNIDTSLPASSECSNVSPDASGTRDCIIHRQEMDASNVGNVHVRAGDESGSWTGTGMAVSLTGEGNAMPFPSSTSLSLSRDLTGVHSSHQLDSGDVVDSTAECLHLSLEELRHHRMSFGKRIWSSVDPYKEEVEGQVWKKVRTVSFLPGSPTDLVSGSQAETADDDISEVEDDGADMDDELERDVDDGETDEHQDEHEHEYAMDVSSSLPSPTVIADGQTERWRERQEKAMMLAVKLAALASTSASTSTSCPQQSGASKDVSEESCVDDGSVCQRIVGQEDGHGQGQGRVQSLDSLKVGKTMGTTKVGVERKRRRSKTEMHGNSHASIAHAINIKSSTSTSTSSSTGGNSPKSTTESQPLSPSSAQSGTSNLSKGQKGKKDLPSKPDFRETKYLLSKYVRLWTTFLFSVPQNLLIWWNFFHNFQILFLSSPFLTLHRMAILNYVKLHGNLQVVSTFSVPSTELWPVETWGLNLGDSYRHFGSHTQTHAQTHTYIHTHTRTHIIRSHHHVLFLLHYLLHLSPFNLLLSFFFSSCPIATHLFILQAS